MCAVVLSMAFPAAANAEVSLEETVATTSLSGSFLAATVATRDNDDDAAVAFYKRAQMLDPDNVDLRRNLFSALLANGRIEDALKLADDVIDNTEASNLARVLKAVEALKKRSWLKVEDHLKDLEGTDLDELARDLMIGWSLFGAGEYDKAVEVAQSIVGPDWVNVLRDYHLGLMALAHGNFDQANKLFDAVIAERQIARILTESFVRAYESQIIAYARAEDAVKVSETISSGLQLFPNYDGFEFIENNIKAGKSVAPLVKSASEGVAELFYNIASAIGTDNGTSFSKTYFQFANYLNGGNDVISYGLGGVLERQKKYEEANNLLDNIASDSPLYRRAKTAVALNLNRMDKLDEAVALLRQLIEENPKDLNSYMNLGALFSGKENYKDAAEVYDAAAVMVGVPKSHHWNLFYRRGIARERLKQWEKAEPNFKLALDLNKDQPDVLNYLGYSWIDMGINLDEGLEMIKTAVKLNPRSGYIIDSLGWAYYRLGRFEEAVTELERAVAEMPYDATINDHLGDAYWKVGRKLEARFQWKHALNSKPTDEDKKKIEAKLENGLVEEPKSVTQSSN